MATMLTAEDKDWLLQALEGSERRMSQALQGLEGRMQALEDRTV